jgi:hypothetical protein
MESVGSALESMTYPPEEDDDAGELGAVDVRRR